MGVVSDVEALKQLEEIGKANSGQMNEIVRHGIDCKKISHYDREEYQIEGMLHFPKDDRPYNVGGCVYCGRCHIVIPDA